MNLYTYILLFLSIFYCHSAKEEEVYYYDQLCPCRSSASYDYSQENNYLREINRKHTICIVKDAISIDFFTYYDINELNINYQYVNRDDNITLFNTSNNINIIPSYLPNNDENTCTVIIQLLLDQNISSSKDIKDINACPGICKPIPYIELPISWLLPPYDMNQLVLCSLSMSSIFSHNDTDTNDHHSLKSSLQHDHQVSMKLLGFILRSIAKRRVEECLERGLWPLGSFSHVNHSIIKETHWKNTSYVFPHVSKFPRLKVYGLIIWIGTNTKLWLSYQQYHVLQLQNQSLEANKMIYGWIASEDQYPCRYNGSLCDSSYFYHWMLPSTRMKYVGRTGWGCAQRRPLRSLAHVLLLYDPDFILLVDDDTYVNMKMIRYEDSPLTSIILKDLRLYPLVLGQLNGGNKVTRNGFFYGGAGYLIGRYILDLLIQYKFSGPDPYPDDYRDMKHLDHLGIMEEAMQYINNCPGDCMKLDSIKKDHYTSNSAETKVRLVDICTNILSEEGTCYHSDHAISRCLIHGAYASVWNVNCNGFNIPSNKSIIAAMCMGANEFRSDMITLHRWMPNITTADLQPMQIASGS